MPENLTFRFSEAKIRKAIETEGFHSAFKRVYGEIRKVNYTARFVQVTARIILHNLRRLAYFNRRN